jgi:hypothetical protein
MADLDRVRRWAAALIALHLDPSWSFEFDNAKKRAGLCNFTVHQILLHEVAHALAGPRAGHGIRWKKVAAGLGYDGKRTHDGETVDELAPWVGTCPAGHTHFRYRQPTRPLACGLCGRGFNRAHLITWDRRVITAAARRRAAAAAGN